MKSARMTPEAYDAYQKRRAKEAAAVDFVSEEKQLGARLTIRKYSNEPTDGHASKRQAKRALELEMLQRAGMIRELRQQTPFLLIPKQAGERSVSYVSDFDYQENQGDAWRYIVEDCKGFRTPQYIIKRKLMLFVHAIKIRET